VTPEELAAAIRTVLEEASTEGSLALPAAEIPAPRVERKQMPRIRENHRLTVRACHVCAQLLGTAEEDMEHLQQILMGDVVVLCIK